MTMNVKIGEFSESHLLNVAKGVVEKKTGSSQLLDLEAEARIPKFSSKELTIGRVLGRGGFCVVSEVTNITLINNGKEGSARKTNDEHFIHNLVQDRGFMASHCIRQGKDCRYAIKKVQESSRKDPQAFVNAVVDLAIESRFLSVIRHPNIIKMRAMEETGPLHSDFFIVLDRLFDILPQRLQKWKKSKVGALGRLFDVKGKKAKAFWLERITVVYDIACALSYLHGMNVLYRDLKPDNIGIDVRGDTKIFDFGLAKEIDPSQALDDGTYKLTGDTGSLRYMAPEVALGKTYNDTCDTFSIAILAWQIFALETPYDGFSVSLFQKSVIEGGSRPKIYEKWGKEICDFLRKAFADNPKRPTMNEACDILRDEISKYTDEEVIDIVDASRKSRLSAN